MLDVTLKLIAAAECPSDLFPDVGKKASRHYRALAKVVHPDVVPSDRRLEAQAAFTKLQSLWDEHMGVVPSEFTIASRTHTFIAGSKPSFVGTLSKLYPAVHVENHLAPVCVKIPNSSRDGDLMDAERKALTAIAVGDPKGVPFFPELVASIRHRDRASRQERRINVTMKLKGWYSLEDVRRVKGDLDPRDFAWMWRRILTALGYAHQAGYLHVATTPDHVLILPRTHGVILLDWCYSVPIGTQARALVSRWATWYPPELRHKEVLTPASDVYIAAHTMQYSLGTTIPQMSAFVKGCTLSQSMRPQNAWELLGHFDDLLERLYGRRRFRSFVM